MHFLNEVIHRLFFFCCCKKEKVDCADTFENVLIQVNEWFEKKELGTTYKYAIATDGYEIFFRFIFEILILVYYRPWDFENFLNMQCQQSNLFYPHWARRWVDVRKMFANWFNVRRCGIEKMLNYLGMEFEGQQHCGLDDAKNISRILMKLVSDGCELKLNERIKNCRCNIERLSITKEDSSNVEMK